MNDEKYMKMPNAPMPQHIADALQRSGGIHLTEFSDMNEILKDENLQLEVGFDRMDDGNFLVSMICPMPGVTQEMIDWWFWWHPQAKERYQIWFPGEHFDIHYDERDAGYFSAESQPDFQPNTQYPTEKIGGMRMPLRIDFVTPEMFGFSPELMKKNVVSGIVCGHVGAFGGKIYHTEMAHIYFQREDGLLLVSRFWIGKLLKNRLFRRAILTERTARGMAEHCCIEYRNLAERLPELYRDESAQG